MRDLTLVIPAKNEKESLPSVLQELKSFNLEILISFFCFEELTNK